jgi:hypothetical protein
MRLVRPVVSLAIAGLLVSASAAVAADPGPAKELMSDSSLAGKLPAWKIAENKDLSDRGWGPVVQEGDRSYRAARSGRGAAVIPVKVWWGQTFRPAEGTVYDLKIVYKDTATQPIVFLAHGGFAKYWGLGEVHRFGGSGDGQWKVALVPISWDLICRKNVPFEGPSDMTEFGIDANADLPVESIQVLPAAPDAADRYGRETRAWVARAQADKRAKASLGVEADAGQTAAASRGAESRPGPRTQRGVAARQNPVLPDSMKEQPIVAYARTWLVPLMQGAAPQRGEAGAPLRLRMARNEYEPAAFGVYANGRDLTNVTFSVSPLRGADGELACRIDLRTVEYSVVAGGGRREGVTGYSMFPMRLWPMYPVDIPKGQSHPFLIDIQTLGEKSKPGTYTGTLTIKADGAAASLPIEVEVLPVTLLTMKQAGLDLGGCSGQVPAQDLKCLAEHNHTGMDVWFGGTQPQMRVVDGKIEFDWTYLDDWMAAAKRYGMDHMMWFLGGDPYGFPDTLNAERDFYRTTATGQSQERRKEFIERLNNDPDKVLPEVRPRYQEFIRQLARHAKANNWPDKFIIHPFDEPAKWVQSSKSQNAFHEVIGTGKWIRSHFEDCSALIREAAKGYDNILVGGDMHHAEPSMVFLDDVDVFCTNAIHEDPQLGDKVRKAGVAFWQYSGTNMSTPAHQGRYTFGFFFGAYNSRGSLIWAYDAMNRFDTSESAAQWGYGWYTPFGTVYTPFMVGVREGFDDRRWMETYRNLVGEEASRELLDAIGKQAIEQRTRGGRDTVSDFFAEMKRIDQLNEWRDQVIEAVLRASKAGAGGSKTADASQ